MVDERTGQINEGLSIRYYGADNLDPTEEGDAKGLQTSKDSLPISFANKVRFAPAIYELTFGVRVAADGKTQLKIADINFVSAIKLVADTPKTN
jgi:hypothetical protein